MPDTPYQYRLIDQNTPNAYDNLNNIIKIFTGSHDLLTTMLHSNGIIELDSNLTLTKGRTKVLVKKGICIIRGVMIQTKEDVLIDLNSPANSYIFYSLGDQTPIIDGEYYIYIVVYYNPTALDPHAYIGYMYSDSLYDSNIDNLCVLGFAKIVVSGGVIYLGTDKYDYMTGYNNSYTPKSYWPLSRGGISEITDSKDYKDSSRTRYAAFTVDGNAMSFKIKRGLETSVNSVTFKSGEPAWSTNERVFRIGDGSTPGGRITTEYNSDPNSLELWQYDSEGDWEPIVTRSIFPGPDQFQFFPLGYVINNYQMPPYWSFAIDHTGDVDGNTETIELLKGLNIVMSDLKLHRGELAYATDTELNLRVGDGSTLGGRTFDSVTLFELDGMGDWQPKE